MSFPLPLDGGGLGWGCAGVAGKTTTFAKKLRQDRTKAEKKLWREFRTRRLGGYYFRCQAPVGPYIADFICHKKNLIVELDGGQHADNQSMDEVRTKWLKGEGYTVLRYWNNEVLQKIEGVLALILQSIVSRKSRTPSP